MTEEDLQARIQAAVEAALRKAQGGVTSSTPFTEATTTGAPRPEPRATGAAEKIWIGRWDGQYG
eukprot:4558321-Lingulodinium_polyedra.AAC.1